MAKWKHNVPTFKKGEPGFADKLNQLADAVRETRAELNKLTQESTSKDE